MTDRENVIKQLEECLSASCRGFRTCPYSDDEWDAVESVLALLREQEPVEPAKFQRGNRTDYFCRSCTTKVGMLFSNEDAWRFHYHFCPRCGKKVKWDA